MATNNPIELLIALGINDLKSKNNIQNYLDKVKKDLKLDIELNTVKGTGDTFNSMRKEIESLQKQVTQLNQQLGSIGTGKSHSPTLSQGIKQDVIESIKSIDQLKAHIKQQNGEYKIKTTTDSQGLEKIDAVVTRVKSGLNQIQETHIKPIFDTSGAVSGLKQVSQTVHDISSKDLKVNAAKGIEELNKFARQGELTKEQYEKFRNSITSSINNTELNKVLESMMSINKETSHENKMHNAMANINQQAIGLSQRLNQFTKDKSVAFDPSVVDKFLNRLDKLAGVNFDSVKGMKSANRDFTSVEKEINTYIKLQEKYRDVTNNLDLLQRQGKITSTDFSKFTQDAKVATTVTELNNLNKEINKFAKNTQIDNQVSNAFKNIGNEVERLNNKLKNVTSSFNIPSNDKLLTKIKSDIEAINNMKIKTPEDIKTLNKLISDTSKNIGQLGQNGNSLKQFETKVQEVNTLLQKMKDSGLLTSKEMSKFASSLSRIETGNLVHVNNLLTQMGNKFDKLKSKESITDTFQKQQNSLSRFNSELTRTEKLFPRTMDKSKAEELRKEIEKLSKLNIINPTTLKANQIEIDKLREKIKQFHADSTQASKGSTGILESFGVAMQKFPIWMSASTIFYGAVRTAKEFSSILIDIDSKLVSIQKVTDDGTDMGAIFDRATQSAETFGQSISKALDAYIEFARQGYKGDELGVLADAGLVASNVGEITAQAASEYMTASLVQWKKDASEAMSIIDSWNNISNNFATTTEKLARGQARSGATARAMGLEFDQLNAIIGTVTASTKQSGDEVGNFVKNVLPRLVSDKAQSTLSGLGISLTDEVGNMRDIIEVYTDVANKVKDISDTERIAVVEGLAG